MAQVMYSMMSDAGLWRRSFRLVGELRGYTYSGLRPGGREALWNDLEQCLQELFTRGRQLGLPTICPVCGESSLAEDRLPYGNVSR